MKLYWIKTHIIIKKIFSKYIWDIPNNEKIVYLTFDDGPTPEITNWVINELNKYSAKATFFCIGNNIKQHPEIIIDLIKNQHSVGNHTFNHSNGWQTSSTNYLKTVQQFEQQLSKINNFKTNIFRPPYGKITPLQAHNIKSLGYKIIMWDILSADFDTTISPEKCLKNVLSNIESGSIIVFHDSKKAFKNLEYALPKTLEYLYTNGFICETIKLQS